MTTHSKAWIGLGGAPPHDNPVAHRWERRLHFSLVTASIAAFFIGEDEKLLRHEMHQDIRQLRQEVALLLGEEERGLRRQMHAEIRKVHEELIELRELIRGRAEDGK